MRPLGFAALGLLALLALLAAGCFRASETGSEEPAGGPRESGPEPPPLDPGSLDQVAAVAVGEGVVFVAGEAGIVRLDPRSGAYALLPEAEGVSSAAATALVLGQDGVLWSAHRAVPGGGGVRRFQPGQARPRAWRADDGLGSDDVAALVVSELRVVAGAEGALAELRLDGSESFVRSFEAPNRKLEVVSFDEEGAFTRRVIEFRPRGERILALALAEPFLWVGTTHGLYRLNGEEMRRYEVPCRVEGRPPRRVTALTAEEDRVTAVLGLDLPDDEWRPGGLLELEGEAAWRCHEPDVDVPDSPALAVGTAQGTTWLATYEGPTRIRDEDAELLDAAAGAPALPATAVAVLSADSVWFGTWGGGVWHLEGRQWTGHAFGPQPSGTSVFSRGELR